MHPAIFAEFHQCKRHLPWQLLTVFCTSAVFQYLVGLPGVLLFLSPIAAASIGVGTLAEEYSKGILRFYYSLPISPRRFWSVKVFSGILGASLFVSVVWLPALFLGKPMIELVPSDEFAFLIGGALAVLAGQAILAYAAGMFTIGFCQIPATAVLLATSMSIIPFVVFGLVAVARGPAIPGAIELGLALTVASLPLWIGAFVLFRSRNPFVDQPWKWRGKAMLFAIAYFLVTVGAGYAMTLHPVELTDPYRDGVYYFSVLDDDTKVFALGRRGLWDAEGYVLDANGWLVRDLFQVDRVEHLRHEPWLEETSSPLIQCFKVDMNFMRTGGSESSWFLINLDTGEKTLWNPYVGDSHTHTTCTYLRPGSDGGSLLGYKQVYQDRLYCYLAFRQELSTSEIREIPIFEDQGSSICRSFDDHLILVANHSPEKYQLTKFIIVNIESGTRTIRELPGELQGAFLAPDGRTCAALRWTVQGDAIRQELAVLDVITGIWKTVLTSENLPPLTVKEALAGRYSFPTVSFVQGRHSTKWLTFSMERPDKATVHWLINSQTGAHFKMPEKEKEEVRRFSKDGSRYYSSDSRSELISIYKIKNNDIELVNSIAWNEIGVDPAWLGNNRLLYLKRDRMNRSRLPHHLRKIVQEHFSDRGELWTVDIETGEQRPFFAGAESDGKH